MACGRFFVLKQAACAAAMRDGRIAACAGEVRKRACASFSKGDTLMFERILFAAAAVATIAGFVLEVWREMKSNVLTDDEGRKKKGRS